MEDSFIVDLYWRRDEQAIAETERKYGGACEGIARRFLPAAEDAEEIVQDAYLSLWNTIPPQRPEHFAAYLFRTVRNAAFSRFRADSAQKRGGGEASAAIDELAECVAGRDNVEQIIEARELSHAVNAFLHTLSRNDRIIFTARYYLALPAPAIAERLGCREGRVHTSLCRSRKRLRDYLIKEELL